MYPRLEKDNWHLLLGIESEYLPSKLVTVPIVVPVMLCLYLQVARQFQHRRQNL